jgi:hypothetical protein
MPDESSVKRLEARRQDDFSRDLLRGALTALTTQENVATRAQQRVFRPPGRGSRRQRAGRRLTESPRQAADRRRCRAASYRVDRHVESIEKTA